MPAKIDPVGKKPYISAIVPVFNGERTVGRCVGSLQRQSLPASDYEVIVVDDGSTDGTAVRLQQVVGIRVVHQVNAGPAAARNRGIREAKGDILVFTDADCQADFHFLEKLVAPLVADPAGVVAAQARYKSRQESWVARLAQIEIEERYEKIGSPAQLTGIGTYGSAYWKQAVEAVGGFNERYRSASGEDFALSYALTRGGRRAVFVADALVYHEHPDTLRRYYRSKRSRGFWRVLLHQQFPQESRRDSYVPTGLKAQIALIGMMPIVGGAWAGLTWAGAGSLANGMLAMYGGFFLASGTGFFRLVWKNDKRLIGGSPLFLVVRAVAIAVGVVAGVLRFGLRTSGASFTKVQS